jgi:hypothetical protein
VCGGETTENDDEERRKSKCGLGFEDVCLADSGDGMKVGKEPRKQRYECLIFQENAVVDSQLGKNNTGKCRGCKWFWFM